MSGLTLVASLPVPLLNDLAMRPGFVYGSAHIGGTYVFDVRDPEDPVVASMVECTGIDVGVVDLASGRRIMTISHSKDDGCPGASPTGGIRLVDVTDPASPVVLGQVPLEAGSHTHTTWGDTGLILNSQAKSPASGAKVEVIDISDPDAPVVAASWSEPLSMLTIGCHDIFAEPSRARAICSGGSETVLWDMTDPLAPVVLSRIRNPMMQVHHAAATTSNGTLLVIGDESGGVAGPACIPEAPVGALWAYDITDPENPVLRGSFVPPRVLAPVVCTAHYYNFIGDGPLLVGAFYTAGTVVVDFSDPEAPRMVDQQAPTGSNTWSSYWNGHDGYVYVGDWGRGLDVFRVDS